MFAATSHRGINENQNFLTNIDEAFLTLVNILKFQGRDKYVSSTSFQIWGKHTNKIMQFNN